MPITMRIEKHSLQLNRPFKISYGTSTTRDTIIVQLDDGQHRGVGEAAIAPYYPYSAEDIITALSQPDLLKDADPLYIEDALNNLPADLPNLARCAIDLALHDLWGKHLGQPLHRLWGLNPAQASQTSYTIGIEEDLLNSIINKCSKPQIFPC